MKKLLFLILAAAMCLLLCACGAQSALPAASAATPEPTAEMTPEPTHILLYFIIY